MSTTAKRIWGAAGVAALVIVAIWYVALFRPESKKLSTAHRAHSAAVQQITQLKGEVTRLQGLERQIPADTQKLAELSTSVPDNPDLAGALDQVQAAASRSGVSVNSLSPSNPPGSGSGTTTAGTPSVAVSMSVGSTYGQLMTFLSLLGQIPRTVVVDKLSIAGTDPHLQATIDARIFYAGSPTP